MGLLRFFYRRFLIWVLLVVVVVSFTDGAVERNYVSGSLTPVAEEIVRFAQLLNIKVARFLGDGSALLDGHGTEFSGLQAGSRMPPLRNFLSILTGGIQAILESWRIPQMSGRGSLVSGVDDDLIDDVPVTRTGAANVWRSRHKASREGVRGRVPVPTAVPVVSYQCFSGYLAATTTAQFVCPSNRVLYVWEFMELSVNERRRCQPRAQESGKQSLFCLCPIGYVLLEQNGVQFCRWAFLDARPHLGGAQLCHDQLNEDVGLGATSPSEFCVNASRLGKLELSLTLRYSWLSVEAMADVLGRDVLARYPPVAEDENVVLLDANVNGTIRALRRNTTLFTYVIEPNSDDVFALTEQHPIRMEGSAFVVPFSFAFPVAMGAHRERFNFSDTTRLIAFLGNRNGTSTNSVVISLKDIPDTFVEGKQMYVEVGIGGRGVLFFYRVARLHISLTDIPLPSPTYSYRVPFNVLYIVLIVIGASVVLAVVLAVLWRVCLTQDDDADTEVVSFVGLSEKKRN